MHDPDPPPPEPASGAGGEPQMLAGRFRVERVLGRGGMGEVLLAHDTLLHRRVALKRVRSDGEQGAAERRAAVLKEARRASQVNDRRIAAIHDVLDLGDEALIVMEYVDGETLRSRLRSAMPIEEFWDLSRQCLEALAAAHARGVIHRDIKPENLMVTGGQEIKILDFGIAWRKPRTAGTAAGTGATETTEPYRAGTPRYMAPEALYGGEIDERTDIFSLGAVFYEMLTASHPFAADTPERVLYTIMNTAARPASELNAAVTPELSAVVERMLARDPAKRFGSCAEVRAALLTAKQASGVALTAEETLPMAAAHRLPARIPRRPWGWALAAVAVVAVAVVTWRLLAMPRLPAERRLAVLPPVTPGATEDFAAYALGTTEVLTNRLMRIQDRPGFQLFAFSESYDGKVSSAADARKMLGANLALVPTLEQRQNRLHARVELFMPGLESSLASRTVDVAVDEPFAFTDSLYHASLGLLGLPMRSATAQADLGIRGAGTLRFLLQGIGRKRAAATLEQRQRALEDFETAYRTEPDPAAPRSWLAVAYVNLFFATQDTSWLARAEPAAREAVMLDSSRSEVQRTLAMVLGYRKLHRESLERYRTASLLDPTDDDAWYRWGRTWLSLGHADSERWVYEHAIACRPHCFKPRWWLASWLYRNDHVDEAMQAFREMIGRNPSFFSGYASLGGLLLLHGEYDRAIDTLKLAVALNPNSVAYNNLGTAYFNSGKLGQAVDAYNQAFQFGDADYVTWMNLGDAYFWLRDRPDQAQDAFRQAVRLGREQAAARDRRGSSPDPLISAHLATIFARLGEGDSSRVMLRQALALDSLNSRVQYQAALTEWQLGAHDDAVGWLRKAVAGGYPLVWLRDSPVHRDWRGDPGFQALLVGVTPVGNPGSPGKAGGK